MEIAVFLIQNSDGAAWMPGSAGLSEIARYVQENGGTHEVYAETLDGPESFVALKSEAGVVHNSKKVK